ncbi:MAG: hypothetical protein EDR02_06515 [Actinobacteria bacterium]|nr:MAG: hypothetical protein EDR02_06515 [Actinomycetota bacterium]RIK04803.1 MAG: hypothetical protein DCC48_12210 [Acidobacteriota bacterium]
MEPRYQLLLIARRGEAHRRDDPVIAPRVGNLTLDMQFHTETLGLVAEFGGFPPQPCHDGHPRGVSVGREVEAHPTEVQDRPLDQRCERQPALVHPRPYREGDVEPTSGGDHCEIRHRLRTYPTPGDTRP